MNRIYASPTLLHLRFRRQIHAAVEGIGLDPQEAVPLLSALSASKTGINAENVSHHLAAVLSENHLIQFHQPDISTNVPPFCFVNAINFELTYSCNLACAHCIQTNLRHGYQSNWINPDDVIRTIHEAKRLGLLETGINFTGGEIFVQGSPLFTVLAAIRRIGIRIRINTNAWWGGQKNIRIGDLTFEDDEAVIDALRQFQITGLALSLDNRYLQYPNLLKKVVRVAYLCEQHHLLYQIVATEPNVEIVNISLELLKKKLGKYPRYLNYGPMELVDIGTRPSSLEDHLNTSSILEMISTTPCRGKGFHRPNTLHVAPNGGLRSCMYAPNGAWLGNISQQSLPEIINSTARNPVIKLFKNGHLASFIRKYMDPWANMYRSINHGCTASALIARIAEEIEQARADHAYDLSPREIEIIHQRISSEYMLVRNS